MSIFTALGVFVFWWFRGGLGYHIAMACDAKARIDNLLKPITSEIDLLMAMLPR